MRRRWISYPGVIVTLSKNSGRRVFVGILMGQVFIVRSRLPFWFAVTIHAKYSPLAPDIKEDSFYLCLFFGGTFVPVFLEFIPGSYGDLDNNLPRLV
jgi:hypothetical protein